MALTKTRQILVYDMEADGTVHFHNELYDDEERYRSYLLMASDYWYDMGKPKEITITIDPGDLLNV